MLDNRHLLKDMEYTIASYQACWKERLGNNPASECIYWSQDIFDVKEEDSIEIFNLVFELQLTEIHFP